MTRLEIEKCLEGMTILVDNREQPNTERYEQRVSSLSVPYRRQTLSYGDYAYNFTLPNGNELYGPDDLVTAPVVIERKMNLEELSGCLTQQRKRFENEFLRASEHNAVVYLLVEDATWEKLLAGHYRTKFRPESFFASLTAWIARYQIRVIFCRHEVSGKLIRELLYRELKEKLERGEYG